MTSSSPLRTRMIGLLGTAAVLAYAMFAALQTQVLNPLATVPGSSLREIHASVGQTADTMWAIVLHALSLLAAVALAVFMISRAIRAGASKAPQAA